MQHHPKMPLRIVQSAFNTTTFHRKSIASFFLAILLATNSALHAADFPTVDCVGLDGNSFSILDTQFLPDWSIKGKKDEKPIHIQAADLLSIRFTTATFPDQPRGARLLFPTGETLMGQIVESDDELVRVSSKYIGEVGVQLDRLRGMVFDHEAGTGQIATMVQWMRQPGRDADAILLRNGDTVQGSIIRMDREKITIDNAGQETELQRDVVAAIVYDPNLGSYRLGNDFHGQLRLRDGSAVLISRVVTHPKEPERLEVITLFGAKFSVMAADLVDCSFRNGKVVYLSDMQPARVTMRPYLDDPTPHLVDRAVVGTPLTVGGKRFQKGIGVRSYTSLSYPATPFARFEATIGVDEAAGPEASVQFQVYLDNRMVFDSGEMTNITPPRAVRVPIEKAQEITLVVDYAKRGDVADFADWCDARLVR